MKDVFIIGAGTAGISCALALARHGVPTVILEGRSRPQWASRIDAAGLPTTDASPIDALLDIRFEFFVDRVTRIDGSAVLVAWSGHAPVIARRGVLAVGATGLGASPSLASLCRASQARSGIGDLYMCDALATPEGGPLSALERGQRVAGLLVSSALAHAA
jgi:glycine/D-amino acid oxidase-like deaminating enzyme